MWCRPITVPWVRWVCALSKAALPLQGRVAWVTGGASGIGLASARALAASGATVVISGRRQSEIDAAIASAQTDGLSLQGLALDVSDAAAVERVHGLIAQQFGPVAVLVCSAGTNVPNRFLSRLSAQDFGKVIDINLKGATHCAMAVLPQMRARQDGVIVVVSSWAGREFLPFTGVAYNASKAALTMLVRTLNHEEGRHGIRATLVQPGEVFTPILKTRPRPPSAEDCEKMLKMQDLGHLIHYIATLPPHVCLNEVLISPTHNRFDVGAPDLVPQLNP
jgi:NAD(P)-dependent dehydrogenase (short-subunit alcohol dehydrogenase family)